MTIPTAYDVDIYIHPSPDRIFGIRKVTISSSEQLTTFSQLASRVTTALSTRQKHHLEWDLANSPVIYGRLERPNGEIGQVFLSEDQHLQEFLTRPLRRHAISFCKHRRLPPSPLSFPSSVSTPTSLRVRIYLHRLQDHAIGVRKALVEISALPVTFSILTKSAASAFSNAKHRIDWKLADSPHIFGHTEHPNVEISKVLLTNDQDLQKFLKRPSQTHCISFCRLATLPLSPLPDDSSLTIQAASSSSTSKPLARKRGLSTSDEDGVNQKRGPISLRVQLEGPTWKLLSVGHPDDADWAKKSMNPTVEFSNNTFTVPLRSFLVDRSLLLQAMEDPAFRSLSDDRIVITHFDREWSKYASSMTAVFHDRNAAQAHDEIFGDMMISKTPNILHSQYLILAMDLAGLAFCLHGPSELLTGLTKLVIATLASFWKKYKSRLPFTWQSIYRQDRPVQNVIHDFMTAFDQPGVEDEIFFILNNYDDAINAAFLNARCNKDRFNEHAVIQLLCTCFFDPISEAKDSGIIKRMVCFGRSHASRLALASRFKLYDGASHKSISPLMFATETELRESMRFLYADTVPLELIYERVREAEYWIAGQSDRPAGREPGYPHYVDWGLMYKILTRVSRQRYQPELSLIDVVDNLPGDCFSLQELQLFGIAISQSPPEFLLERLTPLSEQLSELRTEVWDCPCPNVLFQYTNVLALPDSNDFVVVRVDLSPRDSQVAIFKLLYEAGLLTMANNHLDQEHPPTNNVYLRLPNLHAKSLVMCLLETYARYDYTMQGYAGTEWLQSSVFNFMRDRNLRVLKDFKEATLQNLVVSMLTNGGARTGRLPPEAVLDELNLYDEKYIDRFCDLFLPTLHVVIELKNINIDDLFKGVYGRAAANDEELKLLIHKLFKVDIPSDADFDDDSKSVILNPPEGFKKFADSLTWADLWYEVKKDDGTFEYLSVDNCFRRGIKQLRNYQGHIAIGRLPIWRGSKITTIKAPTQMLKATLLMLLGGRIVITKDLEDIPTEYEFRVEP